MHYRLRTLLQFRLGTLLLVVTLFGVWLGIQVNRANRQKRTVATITAARGVVHYDYQRDKSGNSIPNPEPAGPRWLRKLIGDDYFATVTTVDFATEFYGQRQKRGLSKVDDNGLRCLRWLPALQTLELGNNQAITDAGLTHLKYAKKLHTLYLYRSSVTGIGFVHLSELPSLAHLQLNWTPLTHEGIARLGQLEHLESLVLADTPVTDDDLAALKPLVKLKRLQLHNTGITDDGLIHLENLPKLKELSLPAATVSDDGLNQLQKAIPTCVVMRVK